MACNAAAAALAADDAEEALAAADTAVLARPRWSKAWALRAQALNQLQLFADVLASVPLMLVVDESGATWYQEAGTAQASLQALGSRLPTIMAGTASSDLSERYEAWVELAQADPTSLQARSAIYNEWVQEATRMRDAEVAAGQGTQVAPSGHDDDDPDSYTALATRAIACLQETASDARAYRASEGLAPPTESLLQHGEALLGEFLRQRRPNIPLAAYGAGATDQAEAAIELTLGLAIEIASSSRQEGSRAACIHYASSASLNPTSRIYTLWAAAAERATPSADARRAAVARVYQQAIAAGIWRLPTQRPETLIADLTAMPWHDPQRFLACRTLESEFETIRAEAVALLKQDAVEHHFASHHSKALAAGDWCDVGLYFNAMRNDTNVPRAPKTAALLCSDAGGFRRDCTSCSLGSAYFSLLRPHTRLAPHCGPTNARLRAHLGIVVPPGDCEITCGGQSRRWAEGKVPAVGDARVAEPYASPPLLESLSCACALHVHVDPLLESLSCLSRAHHLPKGSPLDLRSPVQVLLFDDSFEHEVHNETDEPRLVLIVDMWHPELLTDEQRRSAMQDEEQRQRYTDVVNRGQYETTTLRGH